jgi:hypothetical protein
VNWYGERIVVLRHLTRATTYAFAVEADDFNGNTTMSNTVTLTTEPSSDVTPPSVPTNARIVGSNGRPEFFVGWTRSTDDTDPQSVIEYEIYVNGVLSPLAASAGVDQDFVHATGQRREHVHRQGGRSGGQHLGGEQRRDGVLLR